MPTRSTYMDSRAVNFLYGLTQAKRETRQDVKYMAAFRDGDVNGQLRGQRPQQQQRVLQRQHNNALQGRRARRRRRSRDTGVIISC